MPILETGRFEGNGWCVGHMGEGVLKTEDMGIKWAHQLKGDAGMEWRTCQRGMTLSVLISGKFQMDFRNAPGSPEFQKTVIFEEPGTYTIFGPGIEHRSQALEDAMFLTVRWPSVDGDCAPVAGRL